MSQEENNMMQTLNSSTDELVNYLEEAYKDHEENDESKLDKNLISVSNLVDEEDLIEPTAELNDKLGKKRQRKKAESGLEKNKKKKQNSETSLEINEMWDSITNKSSKDGDNVVVHSLTKKEAKAEIEQLFSSGKKKKKKTEKTPMEIAMQVEEVMANLEIPVEDDVEQNRQGKPAINKLMKLPLLVEALLKKPLQAEFLDHGVLNLLKNWLEPLPDGSLPNLNIRATVLTILNDLHINLDQDCRREQLIKSGLGKVIMFYSKSDEETTPNKRLANDLLNKWGRIIYNKSTRYDNKYTREELEEEQRILLRRQTKTAPKVVSQRIATDFNVDVVLIREPKSNLGPPIGVGRAQIPKAMSMDFKIRPNSKTDEKLEARVKMQLDDNWIHKKIIYKLKDINLERRRSQQARKPSLNGRTEASYLKAPSR